MRRVDFNFQSTASNWQPRECGTTYNLFPICNLLLIKLHIHTCTHTCIHTHMHIIIHECSYISTLMFMCVHTHKCTFCPYTYACIYTGTHVLSHTCTYCMHVCRYTHTYAHTDACMLTHEYTHICIFTHTHMHIHT